MKENIFRAYDIRGLYGKELDEQTAYYIGVALGNNLKARDKKVAIVGYDNRDSSISLSDILINGLTDVGIDVISIGLATTAMYYYAKEYLNVTSGVMITASHSPSEYNGMKICFDEAGDIYGEIIQAFKEDVKGVMNGFEKTTKGSVKQVGIKEEYLKMLQDKIKLGNRKLRVVVDCGNGTGSIVAKEAFENAGCEVIPLYCESDPTFPNHHPDPAVDENMADLIKQVLANKADVGIGIDGDADRVGIVNEKGEVVRADMLMIIFWRDMMPRLGDKKALMDVKCTKALADEIIKLGGKPVFNRVGHSYLKKAIKDDKYAMGGEYSGHIVFADEFFGHDDGIYAGLRLCRILSNTNKTVSELLEGVNHYYATPELLFKATDESKFKVVDDVIDYTKEKNYEAIYLDGVRVTFADGWALIRVSNTGPNVTARFEAISEDRLQAIRVEFENVLDRAMKKYLT